MRTSCAVVTAAIVTAASLWSAEPAAAATCYNFCARFILTRTCTIKSGHLVCTWTRSCLLWRRICLPVLEQPQVPPIPDPGPVLREKRTLD